MRSGCSVVTPPDFDVLVPCPTVLPQDRAQDEPPSHQPPYKCRRCGRVTDIEVDGVDEIVRLRPGLG